MLLGRELEALPAGGARGACRLLAGLRCRSSRALKLATREPCWVEIYRQPVSGEWREMVHGN